MLILDDQKGIFGQLHIVNSSMQGQDENILTLTDKLVALKKKIILKTEQNWVSLICFLQRVLTALKK